MGPIELVGSDGPVCTDGVCRPGGEPRGVASADLALPQEVTEPESDPK